MKVSIKSSTTCPLCWLRWIVWRRRGAPSDAQHKKTPAPAGGTVEREMVEAVGMGTPILFSLFYHGPGLYAREAVIILED